MCNISVTCFTSKLSCALHRFDLKDYFKAKLKIKSSLFFCAIINKIYKSIFTKRGLCSTFE